MAVGLYEVERRIARPGLLEHLRREVHSDAKGRCERSEQVPFGTTNFKDVLIWRDKRLIDTNQSPVVSSRQIATVRVRLGDTVPVSDACARVMLLCLIGATAGANCRTVRGHVL